MGGVPLPHCTRKSRGAELGCGGGARAVPSTFQERIIWRSKESRRVTKAVMNLWIWGCRADVHSNSWMSAPGRGKRGAGTKYYRVLFLHFIL